VSTIDQYREILSRVLNREIDEIKERVVTNDLPLEAYRSCVGYISGLRRAIEAAQEAHDKLYGREPVKDTYEDPYG
jgi:uncharacterized coiled-coil DUF342 family protein